MQESWIQVLTIVGTNLLIMLTFFGVTISLNKSTREEMQGDRRDLLSLMREMKDELKDFHGRMCSIEERNRK